jgi:predicted enzyme related to lactoylglutathione lyase
MSNKFFHIILLLSFTFFQAKSQEKAISKNASGNPVGWFDVNVRNLDRAKRFYETVFNVKLTDAPMEWGKQSFFPFNPQSPNISGALVEKKEYQPSSNNTVIYFETEDIIAEEQRIEKAGGKVVQSKMNIGEFGFISIFIDTEGNTVGLHSRK